MRQFLKLLLFISSLKSFDPLIQFNHCISRTIKRKFIDPDFIFVSRCWNLVLHYNVKESHTEYYK